MRKIKKKNKQKNKKTKKKQQQKKPFHISWEKKLDHLRITKTPFTTLKVEIHQNSVSFPEKKEKKKSSARVVSGWRGLVLVRRFAPHLLAMSCEILLSPTLLPHSFCTLLLLK